MYQKIIFVGNLGNDPELRYTSDGKAVTNFSVAVNRKWGSGEETTWFRVSVWGRQAEACEQYLSKGRQVLVEGRLKPDDNGGPRVYQRKDSWAASFEVNAQSVQFLGGAGTQKKSEPVRETKEVEEEIPF